MKSDNYVVIQGWMCTDLGLKGNELLIYALIYGFSQDDHSRFYGSRNYIAQTFNISLPTVDKAISGLMEKGLISRTSVTDSSGVHYEYSAGGCKETLQGEVKKLYRGGKETLPNIDNINSNSKQVVSKDTTTEFQFGKKQTQKKDNLYTKCINLIDGYNFSSRGNIRELLIEYLNFRLSVKDKPLYHNMWRGMLNKLVDLCGDDSTLYVSTIKQSIEKGYLSFYPITTSKYSRYSREYDARKGKPWEEGVKSERYTTEELAELDALDKEREAKGMRTKF